MATGGRAGAVDLLLQVPERELSFAMLSVRAVKRLACSRGGQRGKWSSALKVVPLASLSPPVMPVWCLTRAGWGSQAARMQEAYGGGFLQKHVHLHGLTHLRAWRGICLDSARIALQVEGDCVVPPGPQQTRDLRCPQLGPLGPSAPASPVG